MVLMGAGSVGVDLEPIFVGGAPGNKAGTAMVAAPEFFWIATAPLPRESSCIPVMYLLPGKS